jgi:hypothetical protein
MVNSILVTAVVNRGVGDVGKSIVGNIMILSLENGCQLQKIAMMHSVVVKNLDSKNLTTVRVVTVVIVRSDFRNKNKV